ncbi:MAG: TIGR00153 family protein [Gammaproteobacteria bacterium]|nr:MAG: TIGR00153 family protein [Gammaproteobacteria bacterium]
MAITNPLYKLLGKSPIRPLQEHMTEAVRCAEYLDDFFQASLANDWPEAEAIYERICEGETRADELKKQLRLHLPKSFFMPVSRSDLLELLSVQDHIANCARDIAGLMVGRKIVIPSAVSEKGQEFLTAAVDTTQQALTAINELDELLETGFSGNEIGFVEKLIEELADKEHEADLLERQIRGQLFKVEAGLPPIDVMFLYKIIDKIGDLADHAERVGGRLQLLLAR